MIVQSMRILRFGLLVLTLCECTKGCRQGWFGTYCMLQCHCFASAPCDKDGNCNKCAPGFFGLKCQYVNEAFFNADTKTSYTDGKENTCNLNTQGTVFETRFRVAILLTWFRIIVNNNANLLNFTTKWNGNITCGFNRKFIVDNRTVDGMCDVPIRVYSVRIEGPVVGSLCEFQISSGIYISLRGNISQTSNACTLCGSDKAVDGRIAPDNPKYHCAVTKEETNPPSWFLKFFQPHFLHSVIIHANESNTSMHKGLVVNTITSTGRKIILEKTLDNNRQVRFQINPHWHNTEAVQLSVTQASNNRGSKKQLVICEIYAMGNMYCLNNTYGLNCTECNCSDTEVCNPYTGGCGAACPVGFYGDNCTFLCNTKCLDDVCSFANGTCLRCKPGYEGERCTNECKNQTHGQDCEDICSKFCIGECDHVTGDCSSCGQNRLAPRCIVCPAGFYGENCSYECPVWCDKVCSVNSGVCFQCTGNFIGLSCEDCADGYYGEMCEIECSKFCMRKMCDRQSGVCLKCIGKRIGANCEDCKRHLYGLQCDQPCSRFCFNKTCDPVTGKCDACKRGYDGEYCNSGLGKPEFFTAVLSLFPIAFLIFFLLPDCPSESDDDENSSIT